MPRGITLDMNYCECKEYVACAVTDSPYGEWYSQLPGGARRVRDQRAATLEHLAERHHSCQVSYVIIVLNIVNKTWRDEQKVSELCVRGKK